MGVGHIRFRGRLALPPAKTFSLLKGNISSSGRSHVHDRVDFAHLPQVGRELSHWEFRVS